MQASLAVIGGLLGLGAFLTMGDARWLVGALLLVANWPYTLPVIMPVNRQLLATPTDQAGMESRGLLQRWARLHAVRSGLGLAATLAFFWASLT